MSRQNYRRVQGVSLVPRAAGRLPAVTAAFRSGLRPVPLLAAAHRRILEKLPRVKQQQALALWVAGHKRWGRYMPAEQNRYVEGLLAQLQHAETPWSMFTQAVQNIPTAAPLPTYLPSDQHPGYDPALIEVLPPQR